MSARWLEYSASLQSTVVMMKSKKTRLTARIKRIVSGGRLEGLLRMKEAGDRGHSQVSFRYDLGGTLTYRKLEQRTAMSDTSGRTYIVHSHGLVRRKQSTMQEVNDISTTINAIKNIL